MGSNITAMAEPPILKLPAELRNQIYELVFHGIPRLKLRILDRACTEISLALYKRQTQPRSYLALMWTCKLFRQECSTFIFSNLPCEIIGVQEPSETVFQSFIDNIGLNNAHALRRVDVHIAELNGTVEETLHQELFVKPLLRLRHIATQLPECWIIAHLDMSYGDSRKHLMSLRLDMQDFWTKEQPGILYSRANCVLGPYPWELDRCLQRLRACGKALRQIQ